MDIASRDNSGDNSQDDSAATRPTVVVFDVNETLSDMAPLGQRFADVGAPPELRTAWFAAVLRDGFALTALGENPPFASVAAERLRVALHGLPLTRPVDDAVDHVMAGFAELSVHPDVTAGVRSLRAAGHRLVTLSNGGTQVAEKLLTGAGVRDRFEQLLSVADAELWKPAGASYAYAARTCRVDPAEMMLVAVHPWDIHGAARAGLRTAWINRTGTPYPAYFDAPTATATGVDDLARQLAGLATSGG